MCARITLLTYEEISDVLSAIERGSAASAIIERGSDRKQARPGEDVPGVVSARGSLHAEPFTWGFPSPDAKGLVFNTRMETAPEIRIFPEIGMGDVRAVLDSQGRSGRSVNRYTY